MPSFSNLLTLGLFAAGSLAVPFAGKSQPVKRDNSGSGSCMSDQDAQQIATAYGQLIQLVSGWQDIANGVLSESFTDYSESVNTLIDSCPQGSAAITLPLLSPSFSNRTQFITGQGQQAPINFNQLNIWHSCDTVMIRWETTNTVTNITNIRPVVGMITMETCEAPQGNAYPRYIDTVYSEFDAGAWLQNLVDAGFCPGGADPASSTGQTGASGSSSGSPSGSPSSSTTYNSGMYSTSSAAAQPTYGSSS
jgi:hypothetical protein